MTFLSVIQRCKTNSQQNSLFIWSHYVGDLVRPESSSVIVFGLLCPIRSALILHHATVHLTLFNAVIRPVKWIEFVWKPPAVAWSNRTQIKNRSFIWVSRHIDHYFFISLFELFSSVIPFLFINISGFLLWSILEILQRWFNYEVSLL